jgi:hypothetical protein
MANMVMPPPAFSLPLIAKPIPNSGGITAERTAYFEVKDINFGERTYHAARQ